MTKRRVKFRPPNDQWRGTEIRARVGQCVGTKHKGAIERRRRRLAGYLTPKVRARLAAILAQEKAERAKKARAAPAKAHNTRSDKRRKSPRKKKGG